MSSRNNGALALLAAALALLAAPPRARAEEAGRVLPSRFPLLIEDQRPEDIGVLIGPSEDEIRLEAAPLLQRLSEWAEPKVIERLRLEARPEGSSTWLSLQALDRNGLRAFYDKSRLELRLSVPALARKVNEVSLTRRGLVPFDASFSETVEPSSLSAFVNLFGNQDFRYGRSAIPESGLGARQPFTGAADAAINYRGWVLEGGGSYAETTGGAAAGPFTRGDVRLVHDQPSSMVRYSLGDTAVPVSGFQQSRLLGGFSAVSNYSLQPYRLTTPVNNFELALKSRSVVRVFMNGRLMQTIELPAGRHDIRDLPFSVGVNDIQLEITDSVGRVEIVHVPYVYSDLLLGQGIHQLAYAVGFPATQTGVSRTYDTSNTTYSLSHRYGISERVSLGGYAQGDRRQAVAGLSSVLATGLGNFTLEPAASRVHGSTDASGALRLGYVYADYQGPDASQRNLGLGIEARAPRFAVLGDLSDNPLASYNLTAAYTQQIIRFTALNLSAATAIRPAGTAATAVGRTLSASLSRTWMTGLDTTLGYVDSRDASGLANRSASLFLTWSFPEKRQYVSLSANTDNGYGRAQWNYNPSFNLVGGANVAAGVQRTDTDSQADARIDYTANRARLSVQHEAARSVASSGTAQHTALRASTAIVFAGGKLAVGRPVTDSFVIVGREDGFLGGTVRSNQQAPDRFEAETSLLGPAVTSELSSYRYYQLHLSSSETAPGSALARENFVLFPSYKSGTAIEAGSDGAVYFQGRLARKGVAQALWSGEVRSLDEPSRAPQILFTNREGRFGLDGLRPGRYEAVSFDEAQGGFRFEIPAATRGNFDIGSIDLAQEKP